MKLRSAAFMTVVGLVLSAGGIIVPILWEQYKSRTAMELRQLSSSVVISRSQELDKLQFTYAGQSIRRLSTVELELVNTGRTPIRQSDVVTPVVIHVADARILDARVSKVSPSNLIASHELSSVQDRVTVNFQLLNPGDAIRLTLLSESEQPNISVSARIVGLSNLLFSISPESPGGRGRRSSWSDKLLMATTCLSVFGLLYGLYMFGREVGLGLLVEKEIIPIPNFWHPTQYIGWLNKFSSIKKPEVDRAIESLRALNVKNKPSDSDIEMMRAEARAALTDTKAARRAVLLIAVASGGGIAYLLWIFR